MDLLPPGSSRGCRMMRYHIFQTLQHFVVGFFIANTDAALKLSFPARLALNYKTLSQDFFQICGRKSDRIFKRSLRLRLKIVALLQTKFGEKMRKIVYYGSFVIQSHREIQSWCTYPGSPLEAGMTNGRVCSLNSTANT